MSSEDDRLKAQADILLAQPESLLPVARAATIITVKNRTQGGPMTSLLQTNPYLRSTTARDAMLVRNAVESSVFEGARGLKTTGKPLRQRAAATARVRASAKKAVSKA